MKKKHLPSSCLYAIIDRQACGVRPLTNIARECVSAGVRIIQLRDKTDDINSFYKNALLIRRITEDKALFIINDRADIARLTCADGLHIGRNDLPMKAARKILGPHKIIGKSCHTLAQALLAQKEGADYISIGPIFKTPTKPTYLPVGLKLLQEASRRIRIPIVAIGGINKDNIQLIKETNVKIIAVVRAICKAGNIKKAVEELKAVVRS